MFFRANALTITAHGKELKELVKSRLTRKTTFLSHVDASTDFITSRKASTMNLLVLNPYSYYSRV
ncbi:hypothetical protein NOK12_39400 [Nocardioides sp. OK12]|nr:hypothetical protein NOK12_39400 [Nocardioides sp. OK12]